MSDTDTSTSMFATDTRVDPLGSNRFIATVTDRWTGLAGTPLGGYVLAIALAALRQDMTQPDLQAVSAFFLRPTAPGPVEIHTEIVRAGRRSAVGQARLLQDGRETLRATATFTDLELVTGRTLVLTDPPALPPPEQTMDLRAEQMAPNSTLAHRIAYRVAQRPGWTVGQPSGVPSTELWMRLRDGGGNDPLALALLADAAAPAVMELGAQGSTTVELTLHVRRRPRQDWFACRATTRFLIDGCHDEDFELWDPEGNLLAQSRQLARLL